MTIRFASHLRRAAAISALLSGFSCTASAQRVDPATGQPLPPIVVQNDGTARAIADRGASRGQRRRAVRPSPIVTPAPVTAGSPGIIGQRDGIDGYIASATPVGSKTSTPILQLPRATSTVTQQEITERDAQSVQEALQYTAGVGADFRQGNLTREYTRIRGFEANQYRDGLRSHDSNWAVEPYGLQRIDVLKGPAATLYGQGSPGGLWDLTSKRPTDVAFGEVLLRMGVRNNLEGAFDVGGPVDADKTLLYRVVGVGKIGNGEIDFSRTDRAYFAPSFTWRPNEDTSFTVLASYQNDPSLTVLQPLPYAGTVTPGANGQFIARNLFLGEPGYHNTSIQTVRLATDLRIRLNDVFAFQQNLAYQKYDISLQEVASRATYIGDNTVRQLQRQDYPIELFQADNRLTADFSTGLIRHHALFGMDLYAGPNNQNNGINRASQYLLNLYAPVYGQTLAANPITSFRYQDQRQAGFYAQDRVDISRLSLQFGARFDKAYSEQQTRVLNVATGVLGAAPLTAQTDRATTIHGGAIYTIDGGIAPYASYSESFFPTSGTDFAGRAFVPTTGRQSEAGVKYLPPGLNILVAGAAFDITQNNVLTADLVNPGFAVQTSSNRIRGAELELKTTYLHGLNVSAAYTHLDPTVIASNTAGVTGKAPVGIAFNQASLWATYRFADAGALGGVTIGGGVRYVGESAANALNTLYVPSFTLVDLTARYQLGVLSRAWQNWDIAANVKNVADLRYVGSCDDTTQCYYGAGRVWSLTARARF